MAVRRVVQMGHPALKAKNINVKNFKTKHTRRLIIDLKDTMIKTGLIGIAGPQIAQNYNIFVTQPRKTKARKFGKSDKFRVYINPRIVKFSKSQVIIYEGCGSVAKATLFGPVKRPKTITIVANDEKGKKFKLTCDGILSRVIQHEYDHLFGVEFTEKISDYTKFIDTKYYLKNIKNSKAQINASKINRVEFNFI